MWCHLSALGGLVVPTFGNILGPLLVWQIKKNEIPSVETHGKAALNFQITVTLVTLVAIPVVLALALFCCIGFFLVPFLGLIPLAGMICGVIAGIKANEGKDYRYPWTLTLIK